LVWLLGRSSLFSISILVIVLTVLAAAFSVAPARSKTIMVPRDFKTVQEAINNADPNDVIAIMEGNYSGFTVTKNLIIMGAETFIRVV